MFDDDETEIVVSRKREHFDDDETEVVRPAQGRRDEDRDATEVPTRHRGSRDDFDDDETDVVRHRPRPNWRGSHRREVAAVHRDPRVAPSTRRSQGEPARSLRDRVPEAGAPWQPPERLRSPEHEPQEDPKPSSNRLLLALALLASAAALVVFLNRPAAPADGPESPVDPGAEVEEVVPADGT